MLWSAVLTAAPALALPAFGTDPVSVAASTTEQTTVRSVTLARHPAYDRVVLTFVGPLPGYAVRYVPQVLADATGAPVPLLGSAALLVTLRPTSTVRPAPQDTTMPRFPALRQVSGAGDFEAVTSYGLGTASRSGFRAFPLTGPNRLVIDVQHAAAAGGEPAASTANPAVAAGAAGAAGQPSDPTASEPIVAAPASDAVPGSADRSAHHAGDWRPQLGVLAAALLAGGATAALLIRRRRTT